MEIISNLVWLTFCGAVLSTAVWSIRRRAVRVSTRWTLVTAGVLCLLLLPVISMTDDLLNRQEAALPLASQSWHLASQPGAERVDCVLLLDVCLLLAPGVFSLGWVEWPASIRPRAAWLTRAQRLRPPPGFAC